MSVNMKA